jgi:cysteine desulfurase
MIFGFREDCAMDELIYLDYNATTPIAPEVAAAMRPYLEGVFGNPSSSHRFGLEARRAVETARSQVANLLGAHSDEVIFTSGGSESNNMSIIGTAFSLRDKGRHIITSAIEHPAVTEVCRFLESEGYRVTYVPVDKTGRVDAADVEKAVSSDTILITIMHANNETGTLQPISEIAAIAKKHEIRFHSDGAQSVGKVPTLVGELGVDLFSIAGHKLYAPKGIGALYQRRGITLSKFMHGANHESNRRAGTENVLQIVGLGKAAEVAARDLQTNSARFQALRDRLHELLTERLDRLHLNGHPTERLPNTLNISFAGLEANTILDELAEVAASAGAACHADQIDVSHVLEAMKIPEQIAMGAIRLSVGRETTEAEIDRAAERICEVVGRMRGESTEADEPVCAVPDGPIKLTRYTHGLGCACKIRPQLLEKILKQLPVPDCPDLLVGTDSSDDAAVYRLTDELAIVESLDFFTPIADDPKAFGAIAAANALSDIYAMGAKPLFALNIVGFPVRRLPIEVLSQILSGASDIAAEAGIPIVGGHSIDDTEPKFGWAVTGVVHPDKILANNTARPGDALVLTKPLGSGILSTAAKRGVADDESLRVCIENMTRLNKTAAETMASYPVNACTDITGFGLIGHLLEMTGGSGVNAKISAQSVPVIPEALTWAASGVIPGGTYENFAHAGARVRWDENLANHQQLVLCDAQTSGGLLVSLPASAAAEYAAELKSKGVEAAVIGEITAPGDGTIEVMDSQ